MCFIGGRLSDLGCPPPSPPPPPSRHPSPPPQPLAPPSPCSEAPLKNQLDPCGCRLDAALPAFLLSETASRPLAFVSFASQPTLRPGQGKANPCPCLSPAPVTLLQSPGAPSCLPQLASGGPAASPVPHLPTPG
ncbi:uncharacterized protein B0I36DRAFT_315066 [Microdochium trichocladiopsis]|uniref:Uncharacterized protein n=1 Tax=Microdochium trichocladiopsis TaxID=1682393 RepID=A0A9P8YGX8_9PEZI|nr:uncharacterized protein B0I36DRAFT_315066 [Microdochium trichocladiopsis]KAH7037920.1 hypothetical protein B0I36DRAFT_315066 [Microdochium trichocladiopsis]